jgi:DNA polymerase I
MSVSNSFDVRGRALEADELAAWLSEHSLGNRFGLTVAATGVSYAAEAVAVAIVAADGDGRFIRIADLTADDEAALASWLADPGPPKAVHDAKLAMHALAGRGWTLRGVTSDTVLAAHLLLPERRNLALNDLLVRHMRCALPTEAVEQQRFAALTQPGDTDQRAVQALILQACAVLDLADVLDEELARIDSSSLLSRLELPVQRVLAGMETAGIAVDRALLSRLDGAGPVQATVAELLSSIAADRRIHATLHQTTTTSRISSSQPNLHELPALPGQSLRDAFVVGDGYAELMVAGYRHLEARIAADLIGDADVRTFVDGARRLGYAATLSGRRRYLADLDSNDPQAREAAERAAVGTSIQGSAADIVKAAMINVDRVIGAVGLKSRLLLQVEDQLVFEVAEGERDTLAAYVHEQMSCAYSLDVPLEVSIGSGPTWAMAAPADPPACHIRE